MPEPQEIRIPLELTLDIDYSDFATIRQRMADIEGRYPEYSHFEVIMQSDPYSNSDREYPYLFGYRTETIAEAKRREADDAKVRSSKEARERAEFARLSAKYGSG